MSEIILADHHDQVFSVWDERKARNLKVAHLDFHCDMRGILIDRPKQEAFFVNNRETTFVDRGNFLAHAIMRGMVSQLRWIHAPHGGRAFDRGPVVNYETDTFATLHRLNHRLSGRSSMAFKFDECLLKDWQGLESDEQLDLDWDAFASVEFSRAEREALVSEFLSRNLKAVPETTFLIYSPGYSDPDRTFYEDFAKQLAQKFDAQITRLPEQELNTDGERFSALRKTIKSAVPAGVMAAKARMGRAWRQYESANDLQFRQG